MANERAHTRENVCRCMIEREEKVKSGEADGEKELNGRPVAVSPVARHYRA